MSLQEQYGENIRQTQEAWVKAVETWTNNVQKAFSQASGDTAFGQGAGDNPFAAMDPNSFIDQYFDLAQKMLDAQREVAKNMAKATQSMGQAMRKQAESGGESTQS